MWNLARNVFLLKFLSLMTQNCKKADMADGGHLEFWCLGSSIYRSDARNRLSMLHLVGKVVLHGFLCRFVFKLLFQYGHRRPFWLVPNSAAIFARVMGAHLFLSTSKSSNQVSNLAMLSLVTGPPDITQLTVSVKSLVVVSHWWIC